MTSNAQRLLISGREFIELVESLDIPESDGLIFTDRDQIHLHVMEIECNNFIGMRSRESLVVLVGLIKDTYGAI